MVFRDRTYTVDEYEALAEQHSDRKLELIHGEIVEKMPNTIHAFIVQMISGFFFVFLQKNPLGYALIEPRHHLPDDDTNARIPDLSFVRKEKNLVIGQGPVPFMPDLAVEVQSPGQSDRFMSDKAAFYLQHGTQIVWLVYPDRRLVEVLTPTERHLLTDDGVIDGGEVLPGLQIAVRDIFPQET